MCIRDREKARTVPDSYPMTLNTVVTGCNQKTSRAPLLNLSDAQVQDCLLYTSRCV